MVKSNKLKLEISKKKKKKKKLTFKSTKVQFFILKTIGFNLLHLLKINRIVFHRFRGPKFFVLMVIVFFFREMVIY